MRLGFGLRLGRGRGSLSQAIYALGTSAVSLVARAFTPIVIEGETDVEVTAATAGAGIVPAQFDFDVSTAVLTLGGTMRSAGSSPPVVTLTAGVASLTYTNVAGVGCPGLRVEIDSTALGTSRGLATFRISYDSGVSWAYSAIPTAATYTILDGPAAGNVVNFPAGTYNINQSWQGTIATFRSREGNSYTLSQAVAASQPVLVKAASIAALGGAYTGNTQDGLLGDGSQRYMVTTDAAIVALGTNDPALTIIGRIAHTLADYTGTWLAFVDTTSSVNSKRRFQQLNTGAGRATHAGATSTAGNPGTNTSTTDPSSANATPHNEAWHFPGSNGGANLRVDDVSQALAFSAIDFGTTTPNAMSIMNEADATPGSVHIGYWFRAVGFSSNLPLADLTDWHTALQTGDA